MLFTRLGTLASLGVLGAALLLSCGTDEGTSPDGHPGDGGNDDTSPAGMGNQSTSGGTHGGGTSSGGTSAGKSMGGDGAGNLNLAGMAGGVSDAGAGGMPPMPSVGEQLDVCDRLTNLVAHADAVSRAYSKAAYADCRVKWVVPLVNSQLVEYKNRLVTWSLELWGCQGAPVTELALAYHQPELSKGDATIIIQHYLDVVDDELDLSPAEHATMKAALERLAAPLIVSASEEPSQAKCPVDMGTGGAGGAGPEPMGGAAGAPSNGGAPSLPSAGQGGIQ